MWADYRVYFTDGQERIVRATSRVQAYFKAQAEYTDLEVDDVVQDERVTQRPVG